MDGNVVFDFCIRKMITSDLMTNNNEAR